MVHLFIYIYKFLRIISVNKTISDDVPGPKPNPVINSPNANTSGLVAEIYKITPIKALQKQIPIVVFLILVI